jgi:hypothetical protein
MEPIPIHQSHSPADEALDRRELVERIERLRRHIAALAAGREAAERRLRRQRAAGRRP